MSAGDEKVVDVNLPRRSNDVMGPIMAMPMANIEIRAAQKAPR
jgi:hypothetical protein